MVMLSETEHKESEEVPLGKNQLQLRVLFANFDGVSATIRLDYDATGDVVKTKVLEAWPKEVELIHDKQRMRLLCMGKEIEDNSKTLKQLNIPKYQHPTPINISILPKGVDPTKTNSALKQQPNLLKVKAGCCTVS